MLSDIFIVDCNFSVYPIFELVCYSTSLFETVIARLANNWPVMKRRDRFEFSASRGKHYGSSNKDVADLVNKLEFRY